MTETNELSEAVKALLEKKKKNDPNAVSMGDEIEVKIIKNEEVSKNDKACE